MATGRPRPGPCAADTAGCGESVMAADALVLFGATGDLARKKLFPALYHLAAAKRLGVPVVGVAVSDWDDGQLRGYAAEAVRAGVGRVDSQVLEELVGGLVMVSGDYQDPAVFAALAGRLSGAGAVRPVHYLAIPPGLFPVVVAGLAGAGLGGEGRGGFYDGVGAIRDVIQNHLLQVVALLAMEPPVDAEPDSLRDEKVKIFKAMRPADPARLVRGQYEGYLDELGVAPRSTVETFAALTVEIDSWRWAGVP